jgi:predicted AAA+ superfamily ATPase
MAKGRKEKTSQEDGLAEVVAAMAARIDAIAAAIERLAPPPPARNDLSAADCFVWEPAGAHLQPVAQANRIDMALLRGIDHVRDILHENTARFAAGKPANNALLWGARGMGKSSLVKSVHAAVNAESGGLLKLVEIHREDIDTMPALLRIAKASASCRFILFCDDLSFDTDDTSYKSLKAALEGGVEGRPENVIFYATSNRRHLMPREMIDNERSTAINPSEAVEEKVSLSDRFGLWLGFHKCSQGEYLEMVDAYAAHLRLGTPADLLHARALEWATTRGGRSGRVAWQFIQDEAGRAA